MRRLLSVLAILVAVAVLVAGWGFWTARADPIVREATIALPDWPAGQPPVRAVLISDVHIGTSAMDAARLSRIVAQINALQPELVFIAGDFSSVSGPKIKREPAIDALTAPLSGLHARLGVIATLGNHDEWTSPGLVRRTLEKAGVTVLDNEAVQRGPLVIGGAGDVFTKHQDVPALLAAMHGLRGAQVIVTHSPDLAPLLPPGPSLLLAGHTHCGQIVLPFFGTFKEAAAPRYRCGIIREKGRTIIVTAGLGTSVVPLRIGAPPDLWLLTLGPAARP